MNPFDFLKPPSGTPDDPTAMNAAMTKRPVSEIFRDTLDKAPIVDRNPMFDDMGSQRLDYDPDAFYSIPWADGRGDGGLGMVGAPPPMEERDALEQAFLDRAMQENAASEQVQESTADANETEERDSRRKLGL